MTRSMEKGRNRKRDLEESWVHGELLSRTQGTTFPGEMEEVKSPWSKMSGRTV